MNYIFNKDKVLRWDTAITCSVISEDSLISKNTENICSVCVHLEGTYIFHDGFHWGQIHSLSARKPLFGQIRHFSHSVEIKPPNWLLFCSCFVFKCSLLLLWVICFQQVIPQLSHKQCNVTDLFLFNLRSCSGEVFWGRAITKHPYSVLWFIPHFIWQSHTNSSFTIRYEWNSLNWKVPFCLCGNRRPSFI